jgi:hypothetical protein
MKRIPPAAWMIAAICLVCFVLFLFPNARGATSESQLSKTSIDEPVTYPHVVRMLTPPSGLKDLWERWIIYGDYHYGYPFYFLSAVAVLPVRLVHGASFTNFTGLNLLLLRQLISVLPMLLACAWMVYLLTGFRRVWDSAGLLVLLLSVRGIARNSIQWWHPDALSVLAVVLTLFFLNRDRLRFGRNFYFAAVACGIAAGIKLAGFFFFLAVGGYVAAGLLRKILPFGRALAVSGLFVLVMAGSLILSNPVVYNSGAREEILKIQLYKTTELDLGYSHDDPLAYGKGPAFWEWTLTRWFGSPALLAFLGLSLLAGCLWGTDRLLNCLILGWLLPYSIYLLWFVAVKPDHYWLPVFVPLFAVFFNIPRILAAKPVGQTWYAKAAIVGVYLLATGFVIYNFIRPESGLLAQFNAAMRVSGSILFQ